LPRDLQHDPRPRVHYGFADGLRALAILLIVVFHAHVEIVPKVRLHGFNLLVVLDDLGQLPVAMLFVLSGFLLSRPFLKSILDAKTLPSLRQFWLARLLRIYPLYSVAVAAVAIFDVSYLRQRITAADVATHLTMSHTLFLATAASISGPLWTMAIDAQFYLLLPLLAAIALARTRRMSVAGRVEFVLIASLLILAANVLIRFLLLLPVHAPIEPTQEGVLLKNAWGILGVFLIGVVVQLSTMFAGSVSQERRQRVAKAALWAGAMALGAHLVITILHLHSANGYVAVPDKIWGALADPIAGIGCGLLVLALAATPRGLPARILSAPPAVTFAGLSYAIYLFHASALKALTPYYRALPPDLGFALLLISGLVVILPIVLVSHHLVERPFLDLKERILGRTAESRNTKRVHSEA
jgi:peptidoglycan/LPS O-acetylase OafA/YrhL